MNKSKKSLRRILIQSSILISIAVLLFFTIQGIAEKKKKEEIHSIQDNIAIVNKCITNVQKLESNFHAYIFSGDEQYVNLATNNASDINLIINTNPNIFQQNDKIIVFSHAVKQISQAISFILSEKIHNRLTLEDSFKSIQLAETGFNFLTQETFSLTANYMEYASSQIENINKKYDNLSLFQLILFIIIQSIILIIYFNVTIAVRQSFTLIKDASEKLTENQWDYADLPENKFQEIDIAAKAFNQMKKNIRFTMDSLQEKMLLKELLAEKTLENEKQLRLIQETEFNLLQAQINPHFLFNTLNMITNNVRNGNRNEETADILVATSRLLRDSIEIKAKTIPIEKELQLLNNYLMIQQERNKGRITFITKIEESLPLVKIPPFSLQPLVENSIIHGLKNTIEDGKVVISVFDDEEDGVIISISDNGIGIKAEIIDKAISGKLESNGLGNVIKRLKLQYSNKDVVLFSRKTPGTTINIHLDIKHLKNEELNNA